MGWNDFSLPGAGERHLNADGSSRQEELALCVPGEPVRLVREPSNPYDHMAVAIISARGVCIGYLSRDRAVWVGSKIDRGYDVRAMVERVKGADLEGAALGIVVRINMEGEEPEMPVRGSGTVRIPNREKIKSMVSGMVLRKTAFN